MSPYSLSCSCYLNLANSFCFQTIFEFCLFTEMQVHIVASKTIKHTVEKKTIKNIAHPGRVSDMHILESVVHILLAYEQHLVSQQEFAVQKQVLEVAKIGSRSEMTNLIIFFIIQQMNKDNLIPSRVLFEKWRKQNLDLHKRTLSQTKPVIKIQEPQSLHIHPKGNAKKIQNEIFREIEIQTENDSLVRKIAEYQKKKVFSLTRVNQPFLPGISTVNTSISQTIKDSPNKSLNWTARKQFYQKIDQENKGLLNRLANQTSEYSVKRMKFEAKLQKGYMNNARAYRVLKQRLNSTRPSLNNSPKNSTANQHPIDDYSSIPRNSVLENFLDNEISDLRSSQGAVNHRELPLRYQSVDPQKNRDDQLQIQDEYVQRAESVLPQGTQSIKTSSEPNAQMTSIKSRESKKTNGNKDLQPFKIGYHEEIEPQRKVMYQGMNMVVGQTDKFIVDVEISKCDNCQAKHEAASKAYHRKSVQFPYTDSDQTID